LGRWAGADRWVGVVVIVLLLLLLTAHALLHVFGVI